MDDIKLEALIMQHGNESIRIARESLVKKSFAALKAKRNTILGRMISLVSNATGTETRDISVDKVLEAIRTGGRKLKGQITHIRNRFQAELRQSDEALAKMNETISGGH